VDHLRVLRAGVSLDGRVHWRDGIWIDLIGLFILSGHIEIRIGRVHLLQG